MCTPRLQGQCERHPGDHAPRQLPQEPAPSVDTCLAWPKLVGSVGGEPWCKRDTCPHGNMYSVQGGAGAGAAHNTQTCH